MEERRETRVELPAPTAWPMIAALGVTLLCAGLVTHIAVSATGLLLMVCGFVGWFREVLPVQHEERIEIAAVAPITAVPQRVLRLQAGEMRHRVRYPDLIYPYSSGLRGGIAGGVAMAALACLYGLVAYGSVWYPINLLAATASQNLSGATTAELTAFSSEGLLLGVIIHGVMCILVGYLYAMLLPMFPWHPLLAGGIIAPLMWTGLIWASLRVINPTLNARIDWWWFIASQIGFGLVAGLVVGRMQRVATMQHLPLAVRAGLEAPGVMPPHGEDR